MSSKQREALEAVYECAKDGVLKIRESAFEKVLEALKEPLRNCEVGTVEEQIERFYNEYFAEHSKCKRRWSYGDSALDWAQMPYEANEKGHDDGNKNK